MNTASVSSSLGTADAVMGPHPVVAADAWLDARLELLQREKALTRLSDELARARRALPWERLREDYVFDTPDGPRALSQLFDGRRQLIVQHFMLGPGWAQGCKSCSYMADHSDGMTVHLAHRDISFMAVSRAPLAEIERYRARMGWNFRWVSSHGNRFNHDFHVSFTPQELAEESASYNYGHFKPKGEEMPGVSVFYRDDAGEVFHTYSTFGRGVEVMMGTYRLIDLAPRGRGEEDGHGMGWVRHHDRYEDDGRTVKVEPEARAGATGGCCHD